MDRLFFLTGEPGIGKTTVLLRAADNLVTRGCKVGGMVSREVRKDGVRLGFEIVDFRTGRRGWLAHINQQVGPRVGRYRVNLSDLNTIGVSAILRAIEKDDIIIIDEIGPMELFSSDFKKAVIRGINSQKILLGTIHARKRNFLAKALKGEASSVIEVTRENREQLHTFIVNMVLTRSKDEPDHYPDVGSN